MTWKPEFQNFCFDTELPPHQHILDYLQLNYYWVDDQKSQLDFIQPNVAIYKGLQESCKTRAGGMIQGLGIEHFNQQHGACP